MTVVRPNSIAGINSITVQSGQALNIHDANGNLIRNITSSTGISTFASINVTQGSGDLTVGVSTFFVDNSAGRVGIGTDVPASLLDVVNTGGAAEIICKSSTQPRLMLKTTGTTSECRVDFGDSGDSSRGAIGYNHSDDALKFYTTGVANERLRIASNGEITQTAASGNTVITLKRSNTNTTGTVGGINFAANDGHSVASIQARGDGNDDGAHIQFYTTSAAAGDMYNAANVERLRITSTGLVGIGTNNPLAKLGLHGSGGGTFDAIHITNSDTGVSGTDGTMIGLNSSEDFTIWNAESTAVVIAAANNERFRITSGGDTKFVSTGGIQLPRGTTSERPTDTSSTTPYMRWNSTNSGLEVYNGSEWVEIITDYFPSGSTAFS